MSTHAKASFKASPQANPLNYTTFTLFFRSVRPSLNARRLLFALLFVSCWQPLPAAEPAPNEPHQVIPQDGARDSNGRPLLIPETPSSALHYRSQEYRSQDSRAEESQGSQAKNRKKTKNKSQSKPSNKANKQLARRQVADDPSCRWLDNRMRLLERQLAHKSDSRYGFQRDELKIRETEWQCMKCGGEGPKVADHARCQYRR